MREIGAMGAIWDKTWEQTKVWVKMHQDQMAKQPKYNFNVGSLLFASYVGTVYGIRNR